MVPDRQKVRTDGMDGRTDGRRQNYIPPTSSGDNKISNFTGNSIDFSDYSTIFNRRIIKFYHMTSRLGVK